MKYKKITSTLKTNKSKDYLWNKINTPKKIMDIEGFKKFKVKKYLRIIMKLPPHKDLFF